MALDGIFLRHIKFEIEREALGARVNQVYQPNRDELVLVLRTPGGMKKLLLSARANSPRVNFCEATPENPATPPMFCMLLRKRLGGGKLVAVRQLDCDRALFLDFSCVNELGDSVGVTLACEIMGMYSNIIVYDTDSRLIIDSLRRVDLSVSSQRLVLPKIPYELPAPQDKCNLLTVPAEEIVKKIERLPAELPLSKAVLQTVQGVSPIISREAAFAVGEDTTNRLTGEQRSRLLNVLAALKMTAENADGAPCVVYREDGKPLDIAFMPIRQYGSFARVVPTEGYSRTVELFYEERDSRERMRVKSHSLLKLLTNLRDRAARKLQKQQAELAACADREQLRIRGDLLQANLYRVPRGASEVTVENYYDPDGGTLTIKLNPAVSPAANAQKFYKDYQKAKNAELYLSDQLERGEAELAYLESVLDELSRAETERDLAQIREELTEQGYLRRPKGKVQCQKELPPREFISSEGFKILVGRNNRQNDKLTLKTAAKNDLWFHTKDIHGSHVIVLTEGREPGEQTILEAARLAAFHSKARESSNVPVDYTLVRHVSKPAGAKPGMVIYVKNRTVYVEPGEIRNAEL